MLASPRRRLFYLILALIARTWIHPFGQQPQQTPGDQHGPGREDYVKANFTIYEYRILMRDGKRIFTEVFTPKESAEAYPFLMVRTPYPIGPYGEDQYPVKATEQVFHQRGAASGVENLVPPQP